MNLLVPLQLAAVFVAVVAILRWAPGIVETVCSWFSGERGSFMPGGWMGNGARLRRTVELQAVVSHLALITRLNLPLCAALEAAAAGESRRIRRVLEETSRWIRRGSSASDALESALRGCPVQLTAALRRAEGCGQLARALQDHERMLGAMIETQLRSTAHGRHAAAYATVMALFAGCMVVWFVSFLMPKYEEIFLDFGAPLPGATIALINTASWCAIHRWLILSILVLGPLGIVVLFVVAGRSRKQRATTRMISWIRRAFPVTRTLDYGLGMAKAIRSMALGVRSGAPNAFADTLPLVVSPTNHLRGRLTQFTRSISEGVAPHKAAQDADLGDVFVCALKMVERGDDPERVLDHAADYYEAIAFRWWHALMALSGPLVTLAMGIMVGVIALALFLPLISLIDAVSETL